MNIEFNRIQMAMRLYCIDKIQINIGKFSFCSFVIRFDNIDSPPLVPKIEGTVHKGSRRFRQRVHNGRDVVFRFRY